MRFPAVLAAFVLIVPLQALSLLHVRGRLDQAEQERRRGPPKRTPHPAESA